MEETKESKSLDMMDKDGYPRCCPYGASINYPKEPLKKIHIGSYECQHCQQFKGFNNNQVLCNF